MRTQLSNTLALRRDGKAFLQEIQERDDAPLGCFTLLGGRRCALVRDPALADVVLQQQDAVYEKPSIGNRISERILGGPSVLTIEGASWAERRRLLNPIFQPKSIEQYCGSVFLEQTWALLQRMEAMEAQDLTRPVDVVPLLSALAMANGVVALFQERLPASAIGAVRAGVSAVDRHFIEEFSRLVPLPGWVRTPSRRRFDRETAPMRQIVRTVIHERRGRAHADAAEGTVSLPELLLDARLSERAVESELLAILMAGYQTTALALSWGLYLLAAHQEIQEQLASDLAGPPTLEGLTHHRSLRHVVNEILRLFPSVWFTFRAVTRPTDLGGHLLRRGTLLFVSPYLIHRDERVWEHAEAFRPDRFLRSHPKGSFIPFIRGPHVCLGQHFALMEMMVVLGLLVRRMSFGVVPGDEPRPVFRSVITPVDGVRLNVRLRAWSS